jgi:outer membrane protein assembly factor BamB
MDKTNHPFPDDDAEIEFTDLDSPTHDRTSHELRFSPRTRIWMIVITVMSVVLFLSFTFGSQFYALVDRPQPPQPSKIKNSINGTKPSEISLQMVMGGIVYAIDPDNVVYAIRASNGALIWQSPIPDIAWSTVSAGITYTIEDNRTVIVAQGKNGGGPLWTYRSSSPFNSLPTVVGKRIYIVTNDNNIDVFDTAYGNLLWHYQWHYQASAQMGQPLVVAGEFISVPSESGTLFMLRASDGALLWQQQISAATTVFTTNGNIIYASDHGITALHAKDGSLAWKRSLASTPVQPMVVVAGDVYVATFDGRVSAFNGSNGALLWLHQLPALAYEPIVVSDALVYIHISDSDVYTLHASNGSLAWSRPVKNVVTFAVVDGIAYIVTLANKVEALYSTGTILWQRQFPSTTVGPLLVSNGVIFTGSALGIVYAVRATDSALLWRYTSQVQ